MRFTEGQTARKCGTQSFRSKSAAGGDKIAEQEKNHLFDKKAGVSSPATLLTSNEMGRQAKYEKRCGKGFQQCHSGTWVRKQERSAEYPLTTGTTTSGFSDLHMCLVQQSQDA
jgi:hypothetical protein